MNSLGPKIKKAANEKDLYLYKKKNLKNLSYLMTDLFFV